MDLGFTRISTAVYATTPLYQRLPLDWAVLRYRKSIRVNCKGWPRRIQCPQKEAINDPLGSCSSGVILGVLG